MESDSNKHSGVIAFFNKTYIKSGIFDKELSKIIKLASEKREQADYLDFFTASKEDAGQQIQSAEKLLLTIKAYLSEQGVV